MITGIAKSVSVAKQAPAFSFAFENRIHNLNVRVVAYRWMSPFRKIFETIYLRKRFLSWDAVVSGAVRLDVALQLR